MADQCVFVLLKSDLSKFIIDTGIFQVIIYIISKRSKLIILTVIFFLFAMTFVSVAIYTLPFLIWEINHCLHNLRINTYPADSRRDERQGGRRMPRAFTFESKSRRSLCNCGRNNALAVAPGREYSKRIWIQIMPQKLEDSELFLNFSELRATIEIFA